jgi:hypothetical protein
VLFGLFKGKKQSAEAPKDIYFKSNAAAFEYVERFIPGRFIKGKILIGLVVIKHEVHSRLLLGPTQPTYSVRLAAEGGTVEVSNCGSIAESLAANAGAGDVCIEEGDLVAVEAAEYDAKVPPGDNPNYFLIVAKPSPVLSVADHMLKVYRPGEGK